MDAERWNRVKDLLDLALEQPEDQCRPWLWDQCGGDEALFHEIWSLLEVDEDRVDYLESSVTLDDQPDWIGERIGPYKLVRLIGKGGMGEVYEALRDDREYDRRVALKLIKKGMDSDHIISRFRKERQILAHLEHPNIAKLYDGGTSGEGRPYLVLEYVEGENILDYCHERKLSLRERIGLFIKVCRAIQFAHANLVVHRDLKPGNILVSKDGEPKLLDFGIAKLLDTEDGSHTKTADGFSMMTPDYASPEQIQGENITTATDTYALGILLYELLTGLHPHRLQGSSRRQIIRSAVEPVSTKPSSAVKKIMMERTSLKDSYQFHKKMGRQLRGDLDNIIMMALRKEPVRRYASAQELAEDLERYLRGFPVHARPETFSYIMQKFVQRHFIAVGAAVIGLATVLAFLQITISQQARVEMERDRAQLQMERLQGVKNFLIDVFRESNPYSEGGSRQTMQEALDNARGKLETAFADDPLVKAEILTTLGQVYVNLGRLEEADGMLTRALDLYEQGPGLEHPDAADAFYFMGRLEWNRLNLQKAEDLILRALQLKIGDLGHEHNRVAAIKRELAMNHILQQEMDQAMPLLTDALAWTEKAGKKTTLAGNLNTLARVHMEMGRYNEAIPVYQRAIQLDIEVVGPIHPYIADITKNQGVVYQKAMRYELAVESFEQALDISRQSLGEDHPRTARIMTHLAEGLLDLGRMQQAEALLDQALRITHRAYGQEHARNALVLMAQARTYRMQGKSRKALTTAQQALAMARKAPGERDPRFMRALCEAVHNHLELQQFDEAATLLQEGYNILDTYAFRGKPMEAWLLMLDGRISRAKGASPEALFEKAVSVMVDFFGDPHPRVAATMLEIASFYEVRDPETAISWLQRAVPHLEQYVMEFDDRIVPRSAEVLERINSLRALSE